MHGVCLWFFFQVISHVILSAGVAHRFLGEARREYVKGAVLWKLRGFVLRPTTPLYGHEAIYEEWSLMSFCTDDANFVGEFAGEKKYRSAALNRIIRPSRLSIPPSFQN